MNKLAIDINEQELSATTKECIALDREQSSLLRKVAQFFPAKKALLLPIVLCFIYYCYEVYHQKPQAQQQTVDIVSSPKINDIYFLDFRVLSHDLRPNEKYRLAKVVDITGDIVTLVYGSFYYARQHAVKNAIYYGQLSYKDYFEAKRYDFKPAQLQQRLSSGAIYLAMRPTRDKLFGQRVAPEQRQFRNNMMIPGRRENIAGQAFLNERNRETNLAQAFNLFQKSANYDYVQGQVNLAQMYINGQYVDKNLVKALYWLKQASLQSHKPAILKYEIICKQVPTCQIYDFFHQLTSAGVDVKVRNLETKVSLATPR
ncbi:MAG: tetratricopeptide repeat protein [Cognaticolwellia sp.]